MPNHEEQSSNEPPENPYRVTRRTDKTGRPLTRPQERTLATLVGLCPELGDEVTARAVAYTSQQRLGAVVVILQSLKELKFVQWYADDEEKPITWSPTMTGRNRVRSIDEDLASPAEDDGDEPATAV